MSDTLSETGSGVGATETAFVIIEQLRDDGRSGVTELADALDLSKSSVHGHLQTLVDLGYVVRDDGKYRLGLRFLDLGEHARGQESLYEVAKPEANELAEVTGDRCQVMVEEDGTGIYVYQVEGERAITTDSHIGATVNLHSTSVGKAYLAYLPEEYRADLIDELQLERETDSTITDPESLLAELETVRERGYAVNDEERIEGMRAVGAPILSDDDRVLGSISVSGPTTRMNGEWFQEKVPHMVQQVSRIIGIKATYS